MCIYGLESHPTVEELGIKLGTPGYKVSGLSIHHGGTCSNINFAPHYVHEYYATLCHNLPKVLSFNFQVIQIIFMSFRVDIRHYTEQHLKVIWRSSQFF